ncbi:protein GDAP2 homolog [Phoenix dactylifera]|uniref:Protein GDAP2 homolog n=1 Tax=Phoenix dactylifera TaxID=42345 RepID=A0A8B8ZJB7_PHODC|nr:protein GDAP2 homolog [Phoenix dactylifera]
MEEELLVQTFKVQGRDKLGRKLLRIVGKLFPAKIGEQAVKRYLEGRIFPELGSKPFCVVYFHTDVRRSENFPGISTIRFIYEAIPAAIRDNLEAVYFVHPGLCSRLFLAAFGRLLFSSELYGKVRYVSRVEYLWKRMRRGEMEVPAFVQEHDVELEDRPLMDYGLERDRHCSSLHDAPAMDVSARSMYSLRCIS